MMDPTLEARRLKERSEWLKRAQQQQPDPAALAAVAAQSQYLSSLGYTPQYGLYAQQLHAFGQQHPVYQNQLAMYAQQMQDPNSVAQQQFAQQHGQSEQQLMYLQAQQQQLIQQQQQQHQQQQQQQQQHQPQQQQSHGQQVNPQQQQPLPQQYMNPVCSCKCIFSYASGC